MRKYQSCVLRCLCAVLALVASELAYHGAPHVLSEFVSKLSLASHDDDAHSTYPRKSHPNECMHECAFVACAGRKGDLEMLWWQALAEAGMSKSGIAVSSFASSGISSGAGALPTGGGNGGIVAGGSAGSAGGGGGGVKRLRGADDAQMAS